MKFKQLKRVIRWWALRPTEEPTETTLIWWGSLPKGRGATIGDLHAVSNVSRALAKANWEHGVLTAAELSSSGHKSIRYLSDVKSGIKRLVFVCGPLVDSPELSYCLARHKSARKIAVGVSILPNHLHMAGRFDAILPRDGAPGAIFDLALATRGFELPAELQQHPSPLAAVCLRGRQTEYGPGRLDQAARAQEIVETALLRTGIRSINIDTRLRPDNTAAQIEEKFRSVDLVLTTRMHGALYSLASGKPVVAIDQIPGGAKVTEVLRKLQWPLIHSIADINETILVDCIHEALSSGMKTAVTEARHRIITLSNTALDQAVQLITSDGTP